MKKQDCKLQMLVKVAHEGHDYSGFTCRVIGNSDATSSVLVELTNRDQLYVMPHCLEPYYKKTLDRIAELEAEIRELKRSMS